MAKKKSFNNKCDEKCIVHKLVTHNTCLFCTALRNSPYIDKDVKNKTDEEIVELQMQVEKEID